MSENKRIKDLRKHLGLTQEKFGERIGIGGSAISNIEAGTRGVTDQLRLSICREFRVSEAWLRTGEGDKFSNETVDLNEFVRSHGATELELQLVRVYFELDPEIRRECLAQLKEIFRERDEADSHSDTVVSFPRRPLSKTLQPFSAGTGVYLGPEEMETIFVLENDITSRASFCGAVSGDSMEPLFHDGDILLVEGSNDIPVGKIGVFTVDGDGYVKKRGERELISLNQAYPSVPMSEDSWCNGLVIGVLDPEWIVN